MLFMSLEISQTFSSFPYWSPRLENGNEMWGENRTFWNLIKHFIINKPKKQNNSKRMLKFPESV